MKLKPYILATAVCILASCSTARYDAESFSRLPDIRIEVKGEKIFSYTPAHCQLSFIKEKNIFRCCSDDAEFFYELTMEHLPSSVKEVIDCRLRWSGEKEYRDIKKIPLRVERLEGDRIWLGNESEQIGLVVRIID